MQLKTTELEKQQRQALKYNFFVNVLDGGFFGFALGFASFSTVIPLFVSTLTSSAILIGLIPAIHNMGWQLPQLLTARHVASLKEFKPTVKRLAIQERIPFLGLAVAAWLVPVVGRSISLVIIFMMLIWQGLGGGFAANAWQNMIVKIIPSENRATFFGAQSAASSLLASLGAVAAGFILDRFESPLDYSLCFIIASLWMGFSWYSMALTREPQANLTNPENSEPRSQRTAGAILKNDRPFLWFLLVKVIYQFVNMAFAFYMVYAVRRHNMSILTAGWMTSVLFIVQVAANPVVGWLADHWDKRFVMALGTLLGGASTLLAWLAPNINWFFLVMVLNGLSITAYWTVGLALTLEFGNEVERPTYIGLANTLIAPATILAPILGGWIADTAGYHVTFMVAAVAGVIATIVILLLVRAPVRYPVENESEAL